MQWLLFIVWLGTQSVQAQQENVALHKPVYGLADWKECLVDGKLKDSVISPNADPLSLYIVDLGASYNLTEIKLYAQDQASYGQQGINEPFDVYTYPTFVSPCRVHAIKLDELAKNIKFEKKGQEIVLNPKVLVQFIIIWRPNPNYPGFNKGLVMAEVMAYGVKVRDTKPQIPEDDTPAPNYYKETRRAIIGKQQRLWVEQEFGAWLPNNTLKDVPFGWHHNCISAMAASRGEGRIIAIQGELFITPLLQNSSYEPLRQSFGKWLSPGAGNPEFRKISEEYKEKDILIITRDDKFDVEAIHKKITTGENAVIFGYKFRDGDDDATKLIHKLGIIYDRHDIAYLPRNMPLQELIDSVEYIPFSHYLERYIQSWTTFRTEKFHNKFNARFSWPETDTEETQANLEKFIQKYGALMEYLAPCEIKPYKSDPKTLTAVINYNLMLLRQNRDKVAILPGAERHPGWVDSSLQPTTITVTVNPDVDGWFYPTGAYVKPGEGFRWTVLNNTNPTDYNQFIRVNAQLDNLQNKEEIKRWPLVNSRRLLTQKDHWASPHGGPIFLELVAKTSITIQFENVYRQAYVDLRDQKSIDSFSSELSKYKGIPWAMVLGDSMYSMLHMRSTVGKDVKDIFSSAQFFDDCVKIINNYRGTNYQEATAQFFVPDVQLHIGWGHSGIPWNGHLEWSDTFTNWQQLKTGAYWAFVHELGHNLQVPEITLRDGSEVTNNIYSIPCAANLLGVKTDKPYAGHVFTRDAITNMVNIWKQNSYKGLDLGYYAYLNVLFGEGLTGNIMHKALANKDDLQSENAKTQFWLQEVCNETKYDMVPFHLLWNMPVNEKTKSICKAFECFFPDDEITKMATEKVSSILNKYGKKCIRTGQNQVQFVGDIKDGVGKRRPQTVFIH